MAGFARLNQYTESDIPEGRGYVQAAEQNTGGLLLEHLHSLWDHAPQPVWVHQQLRLIYVNPAIVAALGASSADDLLGRSPLNFLAADSHDAVKTRMESVRRNGGAVPTLEITFQRLDNSPFSAHGVAWAIEVAGQPAVQASFYDTTPLSRAEAALRESEHSRAQVIEILPQLVWTAYPDGSIEYFNQRWYDYTGAPPGQSVGYGWKEILHPDDLEYTVSAWLGAVQTGGDYDIEYRLRRHDGEYRWFIGRANPLRDAEGRITRWFGTSTEIDDQRRTEERLRENEARFRTATRAVSDLLWTNDADGLMQGEQPGWGAYTGQSQAEYQGYGWSKAVHPDDAQPTVDAWRTAVAAKRMFVFEHRVRRHDGIYRLFRIRALPVQRLDGSIREWVGVHTDITDRRAQVEEIRRLNAELEVRVRQRTAELETSNRELVAFSYSVSHDLRAPLRSIDGYSRALEEDAAALLTPQMQGYLERIRAGVQRMGGLIDALLQLSRVTRADLDSRDVDLSQMVLEAVEQVQRQQPDHALAAHIEPGLHGYGDSRLLQVAINNLVSNAFKFTAQTAEPQIWFGSRRRNDGVTEYYLRDNGAGFDMRQVEKLFQAFQRLHGEKDFPGSGIGLATVNRVIARHGGTVLAEGSPGQGATFFFTLG